MGASDDEVRLLARSSQFGYVHDPHRALRDEGEAVPEAYQRELTARGHRREQQRKVAGWNAAKETLLAGVALAEQALGRPFASDLRVLQRDVARIDRRIRG